MTRSTAGPADDLLTGFKASTRSSAATAATRRSGTTASGSDLFDGGDGIDEQVVNGSPTGDDEFTIAPGDIGGT
jgi:hypothetical protein